MANPSATAATAPTPRERLTWQDIRMRYPNEWVVLIELEYENGDEDSGEIASAVVLGHSEDRDRCLDETGLTRAREDIQECAHLYTGELIAPLFPIRWL